MKKLALIVGIGTFTFVSCGGENTETENNEGTDTTAAVVEEVEEDEPSGKILLSPRMEATAMIDENEIYVDYGAPSVRERAIWGELVKYDKVWRAGANETTAFTFSADTKLNGNDIAAGTYAFFIIPKEGAEWTVVLNEEWSVEEHDAWGSSHYDEAKDVLRFDVTPEWSEEITETLTYSVDEAGISFAWEKARFTIAVG